MTKLWVGVDIGGTFTDLALFDAETGKLETTKLPTTPEDLTRGVKECLLNVFQIGYKPSDIVFVSHATTQATNALLEGRGARACLFVSAGYRGIYEVGDQTRDSKYPYDLYYEKPRFLIPPRRVYEIPERIDSGGRVIRPLDERAVVRAASEAKKDGIESISICYLFSFMNSKHEKRTAELISQEFPGVQYISVSSDILPKIREYKRLMTTVVDSYVGPSLGRYLQNFESMLSDLGIHKQVYVMHSGGGTMTVGEAKARAVWCIESGPAAGVMAAASISQSMGASNVVSFDMGGTTAKAALIVDGKPIVTSEFRAGRYPIGINVLELTEIGSGGGSIAWVDAGGLLKVGPQSAGSVPGPACYGKGGTDPTVTDANVVLGYLNPVSLLGGKMKINKGASEDAINEKVGKVIGYNVTDSAAGILELVDVQMAEAIKSVSIERGFDPRDFAMIAFGSAGPMHAVRLAEEIGINKVVIPLAPGITSALGLLLSDVRHEFVLSRLESIAQVEVAELNRIFDDAQSESVQRLQQEGFNNVSFHRYLDMRYFGQGYELPVEVPLRRLTEDDKKTIRNAFDKAHEASYGISARDQDVEIVTYRLVALGHTPKPSFKEWPRARGDLDEAIKSQRKVYWPAARDFVETNVYDRSKLGVGHVIKGPAIIEQMDSTSVVSEKYGVRLDPIGNLIVERTNGT
jgi:N-methylhydantoinase A